MLDDTLATTLATTLAPLVQRSWSSFGMPVLELDVAQLLPVVQRLRAEFGFALFLDVTAVDHPARQPRFDLVYHFLSVRHRSRVRLKLQVGAGSAAGAIGERAPAVPTLTGLYGSARFMEREVHDMYGIRFEGNADLRPILLYEGFVGHPLRKDYPMEREQPIVAYRK
jgi:NADH-quinone oxidoreductase subunit C